MIIQFPSGEPLTLSQEIAQSWGSPDSTAEIAGKMEASAHRCPDLDVVLAALRCARSEAQMREVIEIAELVFCE